jgi:hypothetical protein
MGCQPEISEELPRAGYSERTKEHVRGRHSDTVYVFDKRGLKKERVQEQRSRQSPRRQCSRSHIKYGVLKSKPVTNGQGHLLRGKGHRKELFQFRHRPSSLSRLRQGTKGQGHSNHHGDPGNNYCTASYCKFLEKQYERDLLKRKRAERLPILEYTYQPGKPLRGILKRPQYIRRPRMDELIFVEVRYSKCCVHVLMRQVYA